MNLAWTILFAPLAAAGLIALLGRRAPRLSAALCVGASLAGFALSLLLLRALAQGRLAELAPAPVTWLQLGPLQVEFGAVLDRLSVLMLLVVTGVGSAIQVFSLGYMKGEAGWPRFYGSLSLFMFSMLGIVLSTNFIQMFIFWELVGLSSYLLIGFWFERPAAADAAKKAMLVNRVGDFGFMLGILLVAALAGTVQFAALAERWPQLGLTPHLAAAAALLIFCGAVGKSAQAPLHVWLPDAMEGPTPVSALIHAATMVAAGVYLMCRVAWILPPSPLAMQVVAWTGGATALGAALIAITQRDLKRILAYSTLSQLGYMVMAVGVGAAGPAMFHLTTHAFFKALLFLCAGSVIIALHHEQDIWRMGGLRRRMPATFACFLVGTLALAGVWPLSGFYSKDEILLRLLEHSRPLFALGWITAALTAFYMGRALLVAFFGEAREESASHAHESPPVMVLPLAALALLSLAGGWHGVIPAFLDPAAAPEHASLSTTVSLLGAPALGFALALAVFGRRNPSDAPVRRALGPAYGLLENKLLFDRLYDGLVRYGQGALALGCDLFDRYVLHGGLVGGAAGGTKWAGRQVQRSQNGQVNFHASIFVAGVALVLYLVLVR